MFNEVLLEGAAGAFVSHFWVCLEMCRAFLRRDDDESKQTSERVVENIQLKENNCDVHIEKSCDSRALVVQCSRYPMHTKWVPPWRFHQPRPDFTAQADSIVSPEDILNVSASYKQLTLVQYDTRKKGLVLAIFE